MKLNDSVTSSSKSIAGPEINYEYEFPPEANRSLEYVNLFAITGTRFLLRLITIDTRIGFD